MVFPIDISNGKSWLFYSDAPQWIIAWRECDITRENFTTQVLQRLRWMLIENQQGDAEQLPLACCLECIHRHSCLWHEIPLAWDICKSPWDQGTGGACLSVIALRAAYINRLDMEGKAATVNLGMNLWMNLVLTTTGAFISAFGLILFCFQLGTYFINYTVSRCVCLYQSVVQAGVWVGNLYQTKEVKQRAVAEGCRAWKRKEMWQQWGVP